MSTIRFFNGARDSGKGSAIAAEIMRSRVMKKGGLSASERFRELSKKKLADHKKAVALRVKPFALPGTKTHTHKMSKHAELILKQVAQRKAAKQAKAERQRVFVRPRSFSNGTIVKSGKIYDIAGNTVAKVNTKNGKIMLMGVGGSVGYYRMNSMMATNFLIQDTITKYSPYYINLRKMQAMQQGHGVWGTPAETMVYGAPSAAHSYNPYSDYHHISNGDPGVYGDFGADQAGPRQNVGSTAWGAMSDNVWGTYTDNIWGTSTDTVWGTNTSDVWGGVGGNPWGHGRTHRIWGSGDGHNYLAALAAKVAMFFGLHIRTQASRAAFHEAVNAVRSSRTAAHEASHDEHMRVTRAAAHDAHEHVQTTRAAAHDAHEHVQTTRAPASTSTRR